MHDSVPQLPPLILPLQDAAPFQWLEQAIKSGVRGEARLYSLVPSIYESYARILHPAIELGVWSPVSWQEIAAQAGTLCHPAADFELLMGTTQGRWQEPWLGQLPHSVALQLVELLAAHTQTQGCYLAVWEGYVHMKRYLIGTYQLHQPVRVYGCFRSPIAAILDLTHSGGYIFSGPNLWWPEDRAWFCATDIDDVCTYVGGSGACIAAILDSGLETFEVPPDFRIDPGADTVN
jgi:hypothetical protein